MGSTLYCLSSLFQTLIPGTHFRLGVQAKLIFFQSTLLLNSTHNMVIVLAKFAIGIPVCTWYPIVFSLNEMIMFPILIPMRTEGAQDSVINNSVCKHSQP